MKTASSLKIFSDLFVRMRAYSIPYVICLVAENAVGVGLNIVLAFVYKDLFTAVLENQSDRLWNSITLFLVTLAVTCILNPLFRYLGLICVKRVMENYRNRAFDHILSLPASFFGDQQGDLISRMTNDFQQVEDLYANHLSAVLSTVFYGVGSIVALWALDWRFALAIIGWGLLSTYLNARIGKRLQKGSDQVQRSKAELTDFIVHGIGGREVIKLYQLKEIFQEKLRDKNALYVNHSFRLGKRLAALDGANYAIASLSNIGIYMLGAVLVFFGVLGLPVLIAITQLQHGVTSSFASIGGTIHQLHTSLSGAKRFFQLLEYEAEDTEVKIASVRPGTMLAFEEVTFGYGKPKKTLLHHISFSLEPGSFVCLVGKSGSGKSTVLDLILQFQSDYEGTMQWPWDLEQECNIAAWRSKTAYVPQHPFLFAGTIEENIRLGRAEATTEDIAEAARDADLYEFILSLPDQFNTHIQENGGNLSGGQKQKIALARAFIKHASILLLDEATSALDVESERRVVEALRRRAHERQQLVLLVTHRLLSFRQADCVLFLEQGRIAAYGNHFTLLSAEDSYRRFCQSEEAV